MSLARTQRIDPVKEMRLRSWARRNHVPADARGTEWHPIVLEEMSRIDVERERADRLAAASPVAGSQTMSAVPRYVPLAPETRHVIHGRHTAVPAPHVAVFDAAVTFDADCVYVG